MKTDTILQTDVLDIIFEYRNKSYGAYTLRKFYNNRLYKSIAAVFVFALIFCLISFFQKGKEKILFTVVSTETGYIPPVKNDKKPEKPKEPQQPQKPATAKSAITQKFLSNIQITKNNDADRISKLDSAQIGDKTVKGKPDVSVPVIKVPEGPVTTPPSIPAVPVVDKNAPSDYAEVMPAYPGGMDALRRFLERNLSNPQDLEESQSVSVKIRFVVGYDGTLKSFETVQDGGTAFNNEVIRVLKKMPQWVPGKTKGENVSVYYTLPVKFTSAE